MDKPVFLFLAAVLAGFALIRVPLVGSVFAAFAPITTIIGLLAVIIFSVIIILKAVMALVGK